MTLPSAALAQFSLGISLNFGPPQIPYYTQPPCPAQNDLWSPGYWAYGDGGYYWVPGTWVAAPEPGLLWTPGYWSSNNGAYGWTQGYWASQVGYYGGVNYGYGYYGHNYVGGSWRQNRFQYNTAVSNVNRNVVTNVYANRQVVPNGWNRVSYAGPGGVTAQATPGELAVARGQRTFATPAQVGHQQFAERDRQEFSAVNHGRPAVAAVAHPYTNANRPAGAVAHYAVPQAATAHGRAPQTVTAHPGAPHAQAAHYAVAHPASQQHYAAPQAAMSHAATSHAATPHYAAPPQVRSAQSMSHAGGMSHGGPGPGGPARGGGGPAHGGPGPGASAHGEAGHGGPPRG